MVDYIDILSDLVENTQYRDETDLSVFKSTKTSRGPLREGWRDTAEIIMCCYNLVEVSFPVFGLQARVENFVQRSMRDVMVVSHRRAYAWIDEWYDMTLEDVRLYESGLYERTDSTIRESDERIVTTSNTVTATKQDEEQHKEELKPTVSKVVPEKVEEDVSLSSTNQPEQEVGDVSLSSTNQPEQEEGDVSLSTNQPEQEVGEVSISSTNEENYNMWSWVKARHSCEQSSCRDGIEVIENLPCTDPVYGLEFTCPLVPSLSVKVRSLLQNNNGTSDNCLCLGEKQLRQRVVDYVDILSDLVENTQYREETDLSVFKSIKTGRGPLREGWRDTAEIILCCYKLIDVSFPIFGLQARVENFIHWAMRNVMVEAHRKAFAWIDEWYDMTLEEQDEEQHKEELKPTESKVVPEKVEEDVSLSSTNQPEQEEGNVSLSSTNQPEKEEEGVSLSSTNQPEKEVGEVSISSTNEENYNMWSWVKEKLRGLGYASVKRIVTTPNTVTPTLEHEEQHKEELKPKEKIVVPELPEWLSSYIPRFFYITEKFWNYYPYTFSEFTCSLVPRLSVKVRSLFQNNNGTSDNCLCLGKKELRQRMVDYIDILSDLVENTQYRDETDLSVFKSTKTSRGPLREGWRDTAEIIMCCYKLVEVSFPIFGLQARVENFVQWSMYDEMVVSHRLAFAWIDEWYDMTLEDVRLYESGLYRHTNSTIHSGQQSESVEGIVTIRTTK
ncbi:hypothetical protein Pmani_037201 [Petrolisthes manimaculis]|uniref:Phosphatidylinositol transfer protein N-terminal domain-containing protein n=1 Tax=Petrolisthes manimaculis TaxID=1843537 RepID=A0AAE1NHB0_9EUCA|nr:hypothetical protein Pmani_037201 [Petrolisthes manimaculis]